MLEEIAKKARLLSNNVGGEYTDEEIRFMNAIQEYKTKYNRPFPQWCEVLAVLKSLGYKMMEERYGSCKDK